MPSFGGLKGGKPPFVRGFEGKLSENHMAVGQTQWYHFGIGALPISVYLCGGWDVYWGYKMLNGHMCVCVFSELVPPFMWALKGK